MKTSKTQTSKSYFIHRVFARLLPAAGALLLVGSVSARAEAGSQNSTPSAEVQPVRIKAGASAAIKDAQGNAWLADQGFVDGDTTDRGDDLKIQNTPTPEIYRTEHYGMTAFSKSLPNGKYVVKLHFCETYEDISGPGQRVFSFNVAGQEFKDFDVWAKAGGGRKAYVQTVNADVTNGRLKITFTSNIENPEINGIEIIPAS